MTTKRHGGGSGDGARPRIKSSHERGFDAGARGKTQKPRPRPRTRPVVAPPRAAQAGRAGPKKARPPEATLPDSPRGWSVASESARATATAIAVAAIDKKAVGLEILDVAGKVDYADFLVIMTGRSDRHAQALAQGIEEALRRQGVRPVALEGLTHGAWVLMDFGDVVVHVFQDEARRSYDIEGLWLDARRLPVPAESATD